MQNESETEWVTIAEAARRMAVNERSLRRLLARPEYAAQTRQVSAETRTGTRQSVRLPSALLTELKGHYETWENTAKTQRDEHGRGENNTDTATFGTQREHGTVILAYERVMEEQKARITDLQAALEHEREQTRRLQDALTREQALRSIAPPSNETGQTTPQTNIDKTQDSMLRRWWQIWRRD